MLSKLLFATLEMKMRLGPNMVSQVLVGSFGGTRSLKIMAVVKENIKTSDFILTEDDIPGAKLPKPAAECSCTVLKRWLLCRGAKTTGKRLELQKR